MKIDAHQHYWHFQAEDLPWIDPSMAVLRQDRLPPDIAPTLAACGVEAVVAVQARGNLKETEFLLQLAAQHPHIAGVVGWANLQSSALEKTLEGWTAHAALCGLRHQLQDEIQLASFLTQAAFNRGVALLQSRSLVYDLLVLQAQLPLLLKFCAQHDRHWLVLDHLAKPDLRAPSGAPAVNPAWAAQLRTLGQLPHVVCKLSGLVTETCAANAGLTVADDQAILAWYDLALEAFGPQRLLFGSDWPVCALAAPFEAVHGLAQRWAQSRLSHTEQADFWGGNAQRCYGLKLAA